MMDDKTLESILYLGRLKVDSEEKEVFKTQIDNIISYFDLLKTFDTSAVNTDLGEAVSPDDLREDKMRESFSKEEIESFAIHFYDGFFSVPHIIENFLENKEDG